jgi:hypothetical protein
MFYSFVLAAIISVLMFSSAGLVYSQEENATSTSSDPAYLAIQHAPSGSINEINSTTYMLELNDISDKTTLFSERPNRIFTSMNTPDFVNNWRTGPDSFTIDPPNAALIVINDVEEDDMVVVELLNPAYDTGTNTLRYEATALKGTSIDIPSEFGQAALVIDAFPTAVN